jgi:hypothetical protein
MSAPAPVMTYDTLFLDLQRYSERKDAGFVAQIPSLISLAEFAIATEARNLWQLTIERTTLLEAQSGMAPVGTIQKPARWRKTASFKIQDPTTLAWEPLFARSQEYVTNVNGQFPAGKPQYYADYDYSNWLFGPLPDQDYQIEVAYYSRIQPLDEANQENYLTREAPQAILFGALLQAQPFLKSDKYPLWKEMYADAMAKLKGEDDARMVDKNTSRQSV